MVCTDWSHVSIDYCGKVSCYYAQLNRKSLRNSPYFQFVYRDDMDALMHRLEWTTLLFFASMFVTLECLERLRLIHWFSEQTINLISTSDNPKVQLIFAIIILMWVSDYDYFKLKSAFQAEIDFNYKFA